MTHFGTPVVMEKFDYSSEYRGELGTDKTWLEALTDDVFKLIETDNSVFDQDKIREIGLSNYVTTLQTFMVQETPLSVATYTEIVNYLKYLILYERAENGLKGKQIVFGHKDWKPVNCWREDEWPWSQVPCNPNNLKITDYPGEGLLIDFFRRCVKKGLEARGKDPEKYYSKNFTDEEFKKRQRRRGIHVQPTVQNDHQEQAEHQQQVEHQLQEVQPQEELPQQENSVNNQEIENNDLVLQNEATLVNDLHMDSENEIPVQNLSHEIASNLVNNTEEPLVNNLVLQNEATLVNDLPMDSDNEILVQNLSNEIENNLVNNTEEPLVNSLVHNSRDGANLTYSDITNENDLLNDLIHTFTSPAPQHIENINVTNKVISLVGCDYDQDLK